MEMSHFIYRNFGAVLPPYPHNNSHRSVRKFPFWPKNSPEFKTRQLPTKLKKRYTYFIINDMAINTYKMLQTHGEKTYI